jgi:hypothetical protein
VKIEISEEEYDTLQLVAGLVGNSALSKGQLALGLRILDLSENLRKQATELERLRSRKEDESR